MAIDHKQVTRLGKLALNIQLDMLISIKQRGEESMACSFSMIKLFAVLYGKQMKIDPKNPEWENRDQLVLAKSHAVLELYCTLSNVGYFDKEWLWSISHQGDRLPKKLDRSKTPGIDVTIGALNNGVAIAAGLAMGLKIANKENDIYLVIDEDELKDEHFWQVIQYIARFNLHHCLVIVDRGNKRDRESQLYEDLCSLKQRVEVAGFYTLVIDGMNIKAINEAIEKCKTRTSQVSCIVLDSQQEQVNTLSSEFYSKKTSEMFHQKVEKTILKLQEKIERMS
ncbi:transketolase [Enterococcus hirae]|uniref:transketolase n=1 Tax=Enterococcus TaxID=1350 RepID=UPI0015992AB8|nr:transketolase [Enterococcus hirae]EMF0260453.1 transketolase [Enterococcus hirae]MBA5272352.1 transketolase [Enterococcus hirae]MDU1931478.1 transketolase [Enterococcus hirae]QKX70527.1 transketolase [Enterococcus hirae]